MKASDLFVKCLEAEDIRYVFGVPGEENADFVMSLDASDSIKFILCRHEQAAAFMAEVHGRLTGEPAVCLGTLGPGATNLITGVADANMDRAPILVITGQGGSDRLHKESHQIMDVVSMYEPVTKWARSVRHEDTIPEIVNKSIRICRAEKPGASLIELPEDIASRDSEKLPIEAARQRRPVVDDKSADHLWRALKGAESPLIIAGNGCIRTRASSQLRQFCDKTGIGVVSTFMAKGAVDMNAEYCLFTIGLQAKDHIFRAIKAADVIVTIGFDMVEYAPELWNPDCDQSVLHIDFLPSETDQHYHPEAEMVGDLAHSLWMLNNRVERDGAPKYNLAVQSDVRKRMLEELSEYKDDDTSDLIKPQKVLWDCREAMGDNDILLSDVGAHKMWIARHYHCHEPNTCLIPNGFCSMGFALPGAIAASLVRPDKKILAICGDGGFLMNVQEMETARRIDADLTVMIWEDRSYGLIAWKQDDLFGRHTDLEFNNPDWEQLASAFGWSCHTVKSSSQLKSQLETALAEKGPTLVVVPIDYRENALLGKRLGEIKDTL
ncbi:MAG: acetolactate synthase-1/2/3 large subunit [Candidatus Azotimanducaceae bacterium]|jgi:acetolactate synthase-1/2/3 large subunit